ncbi:MAG: GNAT family N-acetyltransferase [Saprospiraceae bacterium]|nr:GNAT family N-acetyltransferase [Saprospiraceae bacterium]
MKARHEFKINDQDKKRLNTSIAHINILVQTPNPSYIQPFIEQFLVSHFPDRQIIHHESHGQNPVLISNKKEDWIEWKLSVFNHDAKKTIHLFVLEYGIPIHPRNWRKVGVMNQIENGLFRKIKSSGYPLFLVKLTPDGIIETSLKQTIKSGNNRNKNFEPTIGIRTSHSFLPKDLNHMHSMSVMRKYIRSRFNILESDHKETLTKLLLNWIESKEHKEKIVDPVDPNIVQQEISNLPKEALLLANQDIEIYIASFKEIPNALTEIGRLREITYRLHNEGSGKEVDLDKFDPFYKHLFAWNPVKQRLLGAYRIGEGYNIIPLLGRKGLYISSLFKIKPEMDKMLLQCIELGRSFIIKEEQKSNLLLLYLWKAIYKYIHLEQKCKYLIGPVSISKDYSKISRLLIMDYLTKYYAHPIYTKYFKPKKPYRFFKKSVSTQIIIRNFENDLHKFDKLISEIQVDSLKIPVLLRHYLKQNAKVLAFNRDPKFQNVLDALVLVELDQITDEFRSYFENEKPESEKTSLSGSVNSVL